MKHSKYLIHPSQKNKSSQNANNIFEEVRQSDSLPSINKGWSLNRQPKLYDYVGQTQFKRNKFFAEQMKQTGGISKQKDNQPAKNQQSLQKTKNNFREIANTTIHRQTIISKLSKTQVFQITKQKRNIQKFKQYQDYWNEQASKMKKILHKKRGSVLQAGQNIIVQNNPNKIDILNNHVVRYWEMSLRNNNPILLGHIKGHRYDEKQLEIKLQSNEGIKQVQSSIPKLPIQNLKNVKRRQLSLTGRSKYTNQSQCMTQRSSLKYIPFNQSFISKKDILNQQQVYKINYDGDKKWLGTEGFTG